MSAVSEACKSSSKCATLCGVLSILLWCGTAICYRLGAEDMGPMAYMALIAAVGVATLVLTHMLQRKPIVRLIQLPPRLMLVGVLGVAVYSLLLAEAFGTADERDFGQVNLLNYLWPFWIVALGFILLPEKTRWLLAAIAAFLGVSGVLMAGGFDSLTYVPSNYAPHVMALIGGLLWALYSVLVHRWKKKAEEEEKEEQPNGVPFYFAMCALLAAVFATIRGEWASVNWTSGVTALLVLYGGVGATGFAYYWWEIAMTRGDAKLVGYLGFAIPIVSSVLIGLLFRESMSLGLVLGAVLITVGAILAKWAGKTGPATE